MLANGNCVQESPIDPAWSRNADEMAKASSLLTDNRHVASLVR